MHVRKQTMAMRGLLWLLYSPISYKTYIQPQLITMSKNISYIGELYYADPQKMIAGCLPTVQDISPANILSGIMKEKVCTTVTSHCYSLWFVVPLRGSDRCQTLSATISFLSKFIQKVRLLFTVVCCTSERTVACWTSERK